MSTAAVLSDFFAAALKDVRSDHPSRLASRIPELDELIDGGFPANALTELFIPHAGIGEVRMLLPALASMKHVTWVLPGDSAFKPYAPALADAGLNLDSQLFAAPSTPEEAFWCAEQAASSGETSAVVVWLNPLVHGRDGARCFPDLPWPARATGTTIFLIRPSSMACMPSPAELRLMLRPAARAPCMFAPPAAAHSSTGRGKRMSVLRAAPPPPHAARAPRRPMSLPPSAFRPPVEATVSVKKVPHHDQHEPHPQHRHGRRQRPRRACACMSFPHCSKTSAPDSRALPRSSRLTGGELSLALEGLDQTRRITVSVDECDGGIFADALTRHLIRTPVPGCLRRLTLSLSPEAESHAPAEKRMPTGIAARLQARLGPGRVFRLSGLETGLPAPSLHLSPVSDAFVRRPVTGSVPSDPRPALILSEPIPLHDSENGPRWQQEALHLVSGPVQQTDDGVVRDYFVAESSAAAASGSTERPSLAGRERTGICRAFLLEPL